MTDDGIKVMMILVLFHGFHRRNLCYALDLIDFVLLRVGGLVVGGRIDHAKIIFLKNAAQK
jgi:hypothetical protein